MAENDENQERLDRALTRGALFNALGMAGKLLNPVALLLATWLFGAEMFGTFGVSFSISELISGLILIGFSDGITLFVARLVDKFDTDKRAEAQAYKLLGNAIGIAGAFAIATAIVVTATAPFIATLFPQFSQLDSALPILMWTLVPRVLSDVSIASTKAHMKMHHDALIRGFVHPALNLVLMATFWSLGTSKLGFFWSLLVSECIVAALAVRAMGKYFSLGRVFRHVGVRHPDKKFLHYVVPQNIGMALHNYINRLDILMLAAMGIGDIAIAYFSAATSVTRELRAIRTMFSGALAPVFARQHAKRDRAAIEATLGKLSRWTTTLVLFLLLPLVVMRHDLFTAIDAQYAGYGEFALWLFLIPFFNAGFFLIANAFVFSGHSRISLFNNIGMGVANTVLNLIMIPKWGLAGAAASSALLQPLFVYAYAVQLRKLENIHWRWAPVLPTYKGLLWTLPVFVTVGDPATLANLTTRALTAGLVVFLFVFGMWVHAHPEVRALTFRLRPGRRG